MFPSLFCSPSLGASLLRPSSGRHARGAKQAVGTGHTRTRWGTYENIMYLYKKEQFMTSKQIKSRIRIALDNIPENLLEDILAYLEEIQGKSANQVVTSQRLRKILSEDKELLEKLAQ